MLAVRFVTFRWVEDGLIIGSAENILTRKGVVEDAPMVPGAGTVIHTTVYQESGQVESMGPMMGSQV